MSPNAQAKVWWMCFKIDHFKPGIDRLPVMHHTGCCYTGRIETAQRSQRRKQCEEQQKLPWVLKGFACGFSTCKRPSPSRWGNRVNKVKGLGKHTPLEFQGKKDRFRPRYSTLPKKNARSGLLGLMFQALPRKFTDAL